MGVKNKLAIVGALALAATSITSAAQAEDKLTYSFTLQAVSDYMFRGLSYSDQDPAIQSYLEFDYNIFYVAVGGSHVSYLGLYGPWEVDLYAGMRPTTGPVNWDFAVQYYMYGSADPAYKSSQLDYVEFKAAASTALAKNLTAGVTTYFTPDQGFATPVTKTAEGTLSYALPQVGVFTPTLSGLYGWSDADLDGWFLGDTSYTYWNAGLKLGVEKLFFDFRYWDTSIDNELADARFVFSAGIVLP